jgi:hypothetical protein
MILCRFQFHAFHEKDEFGRVTCTRCGKRQPIEYEQIQDPELAGRQLNRPKTRRQRR